MKNKSNRSLFSIILGSVIIGISIVLLYVTVKTIEIADDFSTSAICFAGGTILLIVGLFVLMHKKPVKEDELNVTAQLDNADNSATVNYFTGEQFADFGNTERQSLDSKFENINKMDKMQFVMYVARLFSNKGYVVRLTPVVDNYGIDLIVEKMNNSIAVGCLHTHKVLNANDLSIVAQGKQYYNTSSVMAFTDMFFDRTALDYAKDHKLLLVDRNVMIEDFM